MADERAHIKRARTQHLEHALEIALFRPAHESRRIVSAFFLVPRIVPTRSIRARHLKRELLLVKVGSVQFKTGDADEDNPPALATHARALRYRIVTARRSRDEHAIHSEAVGKRSSDCQRIFAVVERNNVRAKAACEFSLGRVRVDA